MRCFFKLIIITAVVLSVSNASASGKDNGTTKFENPFGIHFSPANLYRDKNNKEDLRRFKITADRINALGVEVVRLEFFWQTLEPSRGNYDWTIPDKILDAFEGSSTIFLFRLISSSKWAAKSSSGHLFEPGIARPNAPKDLKAYEKYIRTIVRRYKHRVRYWQIDNEIYGSGQFWAGSPQDYLAILKSAYQAIKSEDPTAKVLMAGIALATYDIKMLSSKKELSPKIRKAISFLKTVLREGKDYYDIMDLHLYWKYSAMAERIEYIKNLTKEYGYEKPMFITETGAPDIRAYVTSAEFNRIKRAGKREIKKAVPKLSNPEVRTLLLTEYRKELFELVAEEVVKRYVISFSSGASSVYWLRLYAIGKRNAIWWDKMGLMDMKEPARQEGYRALKIMVDKLKGFNSITKLTMTGDVHAYRFDKEGGSVYVLWSESGERVNFAVPWGKALITDALGKEQRVNTQNGKAALNLSSTPLFCEKWPQ